MKPDKNPSAALSNFGIKRQHTAMMTIKKIKEQMRIEFENVNQSNILTIIMNPRMEHIVAAMTVLGREGIPFQECSLKDYLRLTRLLVVWLIGTGDSNALEWALMVHIIHIFDFPQPVSACRQYLNTITHVSGVVDNMSTLRKNGSPYSSFGIKSIKRRQYPQRTPINEIAPRTSYYLFGSISDDYYPVFDLSAKIGRTVNNQAELKGMMGPRFTPKIAELTVEGDEKDKIVKFHTVGSPVVFLFDNFTSKNDIRRSNYFLYQFKLYHEINYDFFEHVRFVINNEHLVIKENCHTCFGSNMYNKLALLPPAYGGYNISMLSFPFLTGSMLKDGLLLSARQFGRWISRKTLVSTIRNLNGIKREFLRIYTSNEVVLNILIICNDTILRFQRTNVYSITTGAEATFF
ncbi:hypothetical protein RF11_13775 [Thelohanellus kitauei]|uniref:Uncharacterized protein n=1 Tax=Thelohanellus kitauei TaxID=669202 RepID=A0A0C2JIV1_THEKT|nr:hypothetical protein RF11_13775 [Thelohanellus kitauei]